MEWKSEVNMKTEKGVESSSMEKEMNWSLLLKLSDFDTRLYFESCDNMLLGRKNAKSQRCGRDFMLSLILWWSLVSWKSYFFWMRTEKLSHVCWKPGQVNYTCLLNNPYISSSTSRSKHVTFGRQSALVDLEVAPHWTRKHPRFVVFSRAPSRKNTLHSFRPTRTHSFSLSIHLPTFW